MPDASAAAGILATGAVQAGAAEGGNSGGSEFQGLVEKLMQGLQEHSGVEKQAGQQVGTETQEKPETTVDPAAQLAFLLGSMGVVQPVTEKAPDEVTVAPSETVPVAIEALTTQQIAPTPGTETTEQAETPAEESTSTPLETGATAIPQKGEALAQPGVTQPAYAQAVAAATQVAEQAPIVENEKTTDAQQVVAQTTETVAQPDVSESGKTDAQKAEDKDTGAERKAEEHPLFDAAREGLLVGAALENRVGTVDAKAAQAKADAAGVSGGIDSALSSNKTDEIPAVESKAEGQDTSSAGQQQAATNFAPTFEMKHTAEKVAEPTGVGQNVPQPEQTMSARMMNQIVRSVKTHTFEGGAEMTLRLDPPHLGQIQMNVAVADGAVTASLKTSTESARQILQSDLGSLKQMLADAGVKVDQVDVSVSTNLHQQAWNPYSGSQNDAAGHGQGRSAGWSGARGLGANAGPELLGAAAAQAQTSYASGQINFLA